MIEEGARFGTVFEHQSAQCGAVLVEKFLLPILGIGVIDAQEIRDIFAHAHIDLVEQAA